MRLRLHRDHNEAATLGQIEQRLCERSGVSSVETNQRTGSVLVHYDRRRLSPNDLLDVVHELGMVAFSVAGTEGLPGPSEQPPAEVRPKVGHSTTAVTVMDALTDLDQWLSELTGGRLDVKLLFPLSLGALAVRQIATTGLGLAEVPGYVLLWYAFDAFYKLHRQPPDQLATTAQVKAAAENASSGPLRQSDEAVEEHAAGDALAGG
jgi:hypothetical protein